MTLYRTTVINGRHCCTSPHLISRNPTDKANPHPDVLPPDARRLWDESRRVANGYYTGAWDLADMAAWRAVKMKYPNGVGNWRPASRNPAPTTSASTVPDPSQMIVLGRVLEYVVQKNPPGMEVFRFKDDNNAPKLMWSPSQKMLLVLPKDPVPAPTNPDLGGLERTAKLYEEWSWGQEPRGYATVNVKDYKVKPIGMIDTIVYRSTKGEPQLRDDPPGSQNYIHQFGDSVVAYQGPSEKDPKAIMIRGGNLDVQKPGIIN